MPGGRPTDYTPELAAEICFRISNGELLRNICQDDHLPHQATIYRWVNKHEEFCDSMRKARECQAWGWAEECLDISDEKEHDLTIDDDGKTITNWEHINRSKLRIETRKWAVGKIADRIFGDKQQVEHTGSGVVVQVIRDGYKQPDNKTDTD